MSPPRPKYIKKRDSDTPEQPCSCTWKNDCIIYQRILKQNNHILGGYVDFEFRELKSTDELSDKNVNMRDSCILHLKTPTYCQNNKNWSIAKHHWPQEVIIEYNKDKQSIKSPFPKHVAKKYGYKPEEVDRYHGTIPVRLAASYSKKIKNYYNRAPNIPKKEVEGIVNSLVSTRRILKRTTICQSLSTKSVAITPIMDTNKPSPTNEIKPKISTPTYKLLHKNFVMNDDFSEDTTIIALHNHVDVNNILETIHNKWKLYKFNSDEFSSDIVVSSLFNILNTVYKNSLLAIKLDPEEDDKNVKKATIDKDLQNFLCICHTKLCSSIFVRERWLSVRLCNQCLNVRRNKRKRIVRTGDGDGEISQHVNKRYFTPKRWEMENDLLKEEVNSLYESIPSLVDAKKKLLQMNTNQHKEEEAIYRLQ